MPKSLKLVLLAFSAVLLLTIFLGANGRGVRAASAQQEGAYRQMQVYSEVLRHVQSDYVEDPKMPQVTDGALRGLMETLDSNSSYLDPEEYKAYKSHALGKAQVGINVSKRFGYATVVSVVPGSPADKANLNDGDIIESIGDKSTRDLSLASVEVLLSGQPGTPLTLSVIRPRRSAPEKVQLTRASITEPAATQVLYENSTILYLKPGVLDAEHVAQVEARLKEMSKAGSKKILLDLRDVSVGDNAAALRLANDFIRTGTLATLEGQKVAKQTFTAEPNKAINTNAPMVTLVNHGTAGPAELVAGALLDNKRSDLVGEKTFGDGAEAKTFELPDGSALILSVAKYATPSGKKLQDEGVTPGVQIASAQDDTAAGLDDEDADTAPATATVNSSKPALPAAKPAAKLDEQLNKALDMLKARPA